MIRFRLAPNEREIAYILKITLETVTGEKWQGHFTNYPTLGELYRVAYQQYCTFDTPILSLIRKNQWEISRDMQSAMMIERSFIPIIREDKRRGWLTMVLIPIWEIASEG